MTVEEDTFTQTEVEISNPAPYLEEICPSFPLGHYPARSIFGPEEYTGRRHNDCYACRREDLSCRLCPINPPGIKHYLGSYSTSENYTLIIPYASVYLCDSCVARNRNVLIKCDHCGKSLDLMAQYLINSELKIYCETCYGDWGDNETRYLIDDERSFIAHFYRGNFENLEDAEVIHNWRTLRKFPLERGNPDVEELLDSRIEPIEPDD